MGKSCRKIATLSQAKLEFQSLIGMMCDDVSIFGASDKLEVEGGRR